MTYLKILTEEQIYSKIKECKTTDQLIEIYPLIKKQLEIGFENDALGSERVLKSFDYAMHLQARAIPQPFNQCPNVKLGHSAPAKPIKSISELMQDNPEFLNERKLDNLVNFRDNGRYFFQCADVPGLIDVLKRPEVVQVMKDSGFDVAKSVKALSRFHMSYFDNSDMDNRISTWESDITANHE